MTQPRSVTVTGGAGFLGSHVVRRLLDRGDRVTVLDDFSNGKDLHLEPVAGRDGLRVIRGDITKPEDVAAAFSGAGLIIHLAVLGLRQSIKEPRRVHQVVVDGTLNCLEAARAEGVELFLNCSSSEVFGSAVRVPMAEDHPLNPETPYAAAKVAQDKYVESYGRTYGLPWMTVRPFNMYGPHSHWQGYRGELIPKMIVRALAGQPLVVFGDGGQTRDFIYVEDAADAVVRLAEVEAARGRTLNVCSGREVAIRTIAESICEALSLDPERTIEYQPARPGDVARHRGDDRAFRETVGGLPSTSLDDGLGRTIEWFRSLPYTPRQMLEQEVLRAWE